MLRSGFRHVLKCCASGILSTPFRNANIDKLLASKRQIQSESIALVDLWTSSSLLGTGWFPNQPKVGLRRWGCFAYYRSFYVYLHFDCILNSPTRSKHIKSKTVIRLCFDIAGKMFVLVILQRYAPRRERSKLPSACWAQAVVGSSVHGIQYIPSQAHFLQLLFSILLSVPYNPADISRLKELFSGPVMWWDFLLENSVHVSSR